MEEEGSAGIRIDRKPSIETEPRTLSIDQIQLAREAALYVMSTRSIEEAMTIFTEGLEAVESVKRQRDTRRGLGEEDLLQLQLPLPIRRLRDVVSAPF